MNKFIKKLLGALAVVALIAVATLGTNAGLTVSAEEGASMEEKQYVPDKYDFVNFYGGVGDIDEDKGDGITTFAHAGLITPLNAHNIEMNTSFKLLSKKAVEEGGNGVDGWLTYSFAKTPADIESDSTIPSYANGTDGLFFHITNYSGTTAPNCVEVQVVQRVNGATATLETKWVDNALNVRLSFSLAKGEDGKYVWTLKKMGTEEVVYTLGNLDLNEDAFVNEKGQTFFSTAIYEGPGCDGNHWEHRDLSVYGVTAFNENITAESVTLSQTEYTYEEGGKYAPSVTVTVNGNTLKNGEDYDVEYLNNSAVGTATAKVVFHGVYGGNTVEKDYTIKEAEKPDSSSDTGSSDTGSGSGSNKPTESSEEGCIGSMGVASVVGVALVLGSLIVFKKKEN